MNVEIIDRLIDQDPTLESSRSALEAMKEGACCIHRSWGLGRISGYETDRGMILIDFEEDDKKKVLRNPGDPTVEEYEAHRADHMPYRSW